MNTDTDAPKPSARLLLAVDGIRTAQNRDCGSAHSDGPSSTDGPGGDGRNSSAS